MSPVLAEAPAAVALAALVFAAGADIVAFEIPNTVSIVVGVMAVAYGALHPGFVWWSHALAVVLMFAFGLLAFARNWLGGGDVKIMTAMAAWTGVTGLPPFFLAMSISGGLLLAILVILRRGWRATGRPVPAGLPILGADAPVPYAVAVAAGAVWWAWSAYALGPLR